MKNNKGGRMKKEEEKKMPLIVDTTFSLQHPRAVHTLCSDQIPMNSSNCLFLLISLPVSERAGQTEGRLGIKDIVCR